MVTFPSVPSTTLIWKTLESFGICGGDKFSRVIECVYCLPPLEHSECVCLLASYPEHGCMSAFCLLSCVDGSL